MENDLVSYQGPSDVMSYYHPVDLMTHINPEIGSLAYALYDKVVTKEDLMVLANWRQMQSDERINYTNNLTERIKIASDERKVGRVADMHENMNRDSENGMTTRNSESERGMTNRAGMEFDAYKSMNRDSQNGMTTRVEIEAKALVDAQKLKCVMNVELAKAYQAGKIHMSDNNYRATVAEAKAYSDAVVATKRLESDTAQHISDNEFKSRFHDIERNYLIKLKEAEEMRAGIQIRADADLQIAYFRQQAQIMRATLLYKTEKVKAEAQVRIAEQGALSDIVRSAAATFIHTRSRSFNIKGRNGGTIVDLEIFVD
jgi:hypothetical protein